MKRLASVSILSLLLMGACGNEEPEPEVQVPGPETNVTEEEPSEEETNGDGEESTEETDGSNEEEPSSEESEEDSESVDPHAFFMEDGTTAHFKGEGNEFAQLTLQTEHLDDEHVALSENNGGTTILRVYRVSDDKIEMVKEEPEYYEEFSATSEELQELEPMSTYLEFPLEEGNEINGKTVVETGATVETPYQTFEDAYVLESKGDDGSTNKWYLVEGFGEVKREFIMSETENPVTVSSSLESIE